MALFDTDGDGATIFFPEVGHSAEVIEPDGTATTLTGMCWLDGRDKNGKGLPPDGTSFDRNGRVPSLSSALGRGLIDKAQTQTASDLLGTSSPVIQASLRLTGGKLIARDPDLCSGDEDYGSTEWQIGPVTSKLTNRVDFELKIKKGFTYSLIINGGANAIPLADPDNTTLVIQNVDAPNLDCAEMERIEVAADTSHDVVLADFEELYKLLEGSPIGPAPTLTKKTAIQWLYPTRPLCPVGEP